MAQEISTAQRLYNAAAQGDIDQIQEMLGSGIDINTQERYGKTALRLAIHKISEEIDDIYAQALQTTRADIQLLRAKHDFLTPMPKLQHDSYSRNDIISMVQASLGGGYESFQLLLDFGADINLLDPSGYTHLFYAVLGVKEELVSILLNHGADPGVTDEDGDTPLHSAFRMDYSYEVCRLLLDHGANALAENEMGQTPYQCIDLHTLSQDEQEGLLAAYPALGGPAGADLDT